MRTLLPSLAVSSHSGSAPKRKAPQCGAFKNWGRKPSGFEQSDCRCLPGFAPLDDGQTSCRCLDTTSHRSYAGPADRLRSTHHARYQPILWITSAGTTGTRHPGCIWVECLNFELCLAATLHELAEFVRGQSAPNVATVKAGIELLSLLQWHRTGECHEPEAVWVKAGRRAVIRRRQQTTLNRITAWHTGHLVMWNMMPEPGRNRVCVRGQPYRIAVALGLQRGIDQESSHRPPCLPCPPQRNQAS